MITEPMVNMTLRNPAMGNRGQLVMLRSIIRQIADWRSQGLLEARSPAVPVTIEIHYAGETDPPHGPHIDARVDRLAAALELAAEELRNA